MSSPKNTIKDEESKLIITDKERELYKNDIISFFEKEVILENNKRIELEPWQRKILRRIFDTKRRRRKDTRQYRLALVMIPKKNGKSLMAACVAVWHLLFDDADGHAEAYVAASDLDQARIIGRKIEGILKRNERLYRLVTIKRDLIERRDDKGFLRILASDAASAHGVEPSLVVFDELWSAQSEQLFSALTLPPTRRQPLCFCISYAGYDKDSLLYRLFERGKKGKDKQMFFFHSQKNLASWISQDYLKSQKSLLHPAEYARMHECRWTDAANSFLDSNDIKKCVDDNLLPAAKADPRFSYFCGVDLGIKNDRTVCTVCHFDFNLNAVILDEVVSWQGDPKNPVDIRGVQDYLEESHQRFNFRKLVIDPWQAVQLSQNLKDKRLPVEEFGFSGANINRLTMNLFNLFHNSRIKIFEHKELINELQTVQAVATSYGMRVDTRGNRHDDFVISLGLSALFAVQYQKPKTLPEVWFFGPKDDDF